MLIRLEEKLHKIKIYEMDVRDFLKRLKYEKEIFELSKQYSGG